MKKIFIFLLVLGALTSINFDLFAFTFNNEDSPAGITLDTLINELNGYSLREIFEDNLVTQNDIFNEVDSIGSYIDGIYTNSSIGNTATPYFTAFGTLTIGNTYYYRTSVRALNNDILEIRMYRGVNDDALINNPLINYDYNLTSYGVAGFNYIRFYHSYVQAVQGEQIAVQVKEFYIIDITSMGLINTKQELDYYYTIYYLLKNGINPTTLYADYYTEGQIDGYAEGYNDGFSDGYNDGYNDGYGFGQEDGYDTGYLDGNVAGLETGYLNGYNDGFDEGILSDVDTSWLLNFVSGTVNVLGVSIVPGISLGVFVFIPLFLGFIGFIFRLGGRRG